MYILRGPIGGQLLQVRTNVFVDVSLISPICFLLLGYGFLPGTVASLLDFIVSAQEKEVCTWWSSNQLM